MNAPEQILRTIARHLEGPAHLRLMGGAALVLGYGLDRTTEDADLLLDDREMTTLIDEANIGAALESANRELEPVGLYVTHIWGPEQQILTPEWRESCRRLDQDFGSRGLIVSVLGPLDLIASKLCRADDGDLFDIRFLIESQSIDRITLESALGRAVVPSDFEHVFPVNRDKALALF